MKVTKAKMILSSPWKSPSPVRVLASICRAGPQVLLPSVVPRKLLRLHLSSSDRQNVGTSLKRGPCLCNGQPPPDTFKLGSVALQKATLSSLLPEERGD